MRTQTAPAPQAGAGRSRDRFRPSDPRPAAPGVPCDDCRAKGFHRAATRLEGGIALCGPCQKDRVDQLLAAWGARLGVSL